MPNPPRPEVTPTEEEIQQAIAEIKASPWHPRDVRYGDELYRGAAVQMLRHRASEERVVVPAEKLLSACPECGDRLDYFRVVTEFDDDGMPSVSIVYPCQWCQKLTRVSCEAPRRAP